ncbi:hypothetical protein FM076_07570 [Streptomyces albus subsp. chlorinus]|uniref:DUF6083 domain-containing protein n=1 Tax=Streptomyces albus TaxID=1888 RepID=UPI00156D4305|nr:DUF6083 domain-containing protein [Streptomyces albus]NSC21077.1 hypothetical protein [Streptomyces albus subsp. chlorinus]
MGEPEAARRCLACQQPHPGVVDRGSPFGPHCPSCWSALRNARWSELENACDDGQARTEGAAAPPPPAEPRCAGCGILRERRETGYRKWVLLEPDIAVPWHLLPVGHRWVVAEDGIALNTGTRPLPADSLCRVPHALVCPGDEPPAQLVPFFTALWQENQRRPHHHYLPTLDGAPKADPAP